MTRWARVQSTHRTQKQPEDSTPWEEFQQQRNQLRQNRSATSDDKSQPDGQQQASEPKKGIHREPDKKRRITDEERKRLKKERILKKMREEREKKGLVLLPEKIEKKIYRMKKAMRSKGKSAQEIKCEIRQFRRKEELTYRKQCAKACLHCREPGHKVADCPSAPKVGICYKCGASDHTSSSCLKASSDDGYKFAACFVCGQQGHISRECPKNENGAYPKGGGCRFCGSNKHKKQECPELRKRSSNQQSDDDEVVAEVVTDVKVNVDTQLTKVPSKLLVSPPKPKRIRF